MKLYKLTYTQESEAFVSAESEEEAREYITELTQNGGERMNEVRLNECGWSVTEEWENLSLISDDEQDEFDGHTHTTEDGSAWYSEGRLFWDQGE